VKLPDRIGDGRHLAQLPAQTIRAAGVLLTQDQLGDTFNHQPGLYEMHSAVLLTSVFSIRSLGKVSLVSAALLNISRKLRGASSGNDWLGQGARGF
jgi:hypothetical protein